MSEERAVQQVLAKYVRGSDARDGTAVAAQFTELGRAGYRCCSIADSAPSVRTVLARMNIKDLLRLVELVEAGSLTVEVAATYPLEDAARAQLALRNGGKKPGKIVLDVG